LVGLDLINKFRDNSVITEKACKIRAARRYNSKVAPRSFQKGDLVWRMHNEVRKNERKFSSNWEGQFRVKDIMVDRAYYLEHPLEKIVPRTWNVTHLKIYYSWHIEYYTISALG